MNVEQARFNMIEQQIRPWGVMDAHLLDLLRSLQRDLTVPGHSLVPFCLNGSEHLRGNLFNRQGAVDIS